MAFEPLRWSSHRPYPGQLWKRDGVQVVIVAVSRRSITYDNLTTGERAIQGLEAFLHGSRRMRG